MIHRAAHSGCPGLIERLQASVANCAFEPDRQARPGRPASAPTSTARGPASAGARDPRCRSCRSSSGGRASQMAKPPHQRTGPREPADSSRFQLRKGRRSGSDERLFALVDGDARLIAATIATSAARALLPSSILIATPSPRSGSAAQSTPPRRPCSTPVHRTAHDAGVKALAAADHVRRVATAACSRLAARAWPSLKPTPLPKRANARASWRSGLANVGIEQPSMARGARVRGRCRWLRQARR